MQCILDVFTSPQTPFLVMFATFPPFLIQLCFYPLLLLPLLRSFPFTSPSSMNPVFVEQLVRVGYALVCG